MAAVLERRRYCDQCERYVLARRRSVNHILHVLLTLATCGMWLPTWLLLTSLDVVSVNAWLCPRCGSSCRARSSERRRWTAPSLLQVSVFVYAMFFIALIIIIVGLVVL